MGRGSRNTIRWLAAGVAGGLRLPERYARRRRREGRWGIILRYHRIIPAEEPPSYYRMGIDTALFEAQVSWLASHADVVPLEELLQRLGSGQPPSHDLVVLTFDDGYRDNRTEAAPILQRFGLPATFYVTSSCLTERMPFWPEVLAQVVRLTERETLSLTLGEEPLIVRLDGEEARRRGCLHLVAHLRKRAMAEIAEALERIAGRLDVDLDRAREATPPVMDGEDLRALASAGFTIGSHTVTHPYLAAEEHERQRWELAESRHQLEEVVGRPVLDFCYPGGGYDEATRELVAAVGYRSATTSDLGIVGFGDDPYRLGRIGVGRALATGPRGRFSSAMMRAEITGYFSDLYRIGRRRGSEGAGG